MQVVRWIRKVGCTIIAKVRGKVGWQKVGGKVVGEVGGEMGW